MRDERRPALKLLEVTAHGGAIHLLKDVENDISPGGSFYNNLKQNK